MTSRHLLFLAPVGAALACLVLPAHAQSVDELKAEIASQRAALQAQQRRLDALEAALSQVAAAAPPKAPEAPDGSVAVGALPGSYKVPGTATSLRISGWINLAVNKDLGQYLGSKFAIGNLQPNDTPAAHQRGNMSMNPKLNRLIFETLTPDTPYGPLHTMFSTDFFGSEKKTDAQEGLQNNSYHLRLVQAYAELGGLLVGQTWSNFVDDPDSAETLDSAGSAGTLSERTPQIRYTRSLGTLGSLSVAAENPVGDYQTEGGPGASAYAISTVNRIPDISVKYELGGRWGHAQVAGLFRRFHYDDGSGHSAAATGTGLMAGGTLNLGAVSAAFGKDSVGGQVWRGDGIGHYVPDDFGQPTAFALSNAGTPAAHAQGQMLQGHVVFARHFWSPQWRSTLAIGMDHESFASFVAPAPDQAVTLRTVHGNLIYSPLPSVSLGVELAHGTKQFRSELGLSDGVDTRISLGGRFRF